MKAASKRVRLSAFCCTVPSIICFRFSAITLVFVPTDVVGYSTQEIAGGKLTCAALQFTTVAGEGASLADISTTGLNPGIYDTMDEEAPSLMIYDGNGGYDYYFYISDGDDGTERFDLTGWVDAGGNIVDEVGTVGTGFWLRIPESTCTTGAMTEAGQVLTAVTATIDIAAGLTLAGNPYPASLDFSKVVTAGLTPGIYDTMDEEAPCLMIYDGNGGYDYYFYISDGDDGTERFDLTGWVDAGGNIVDVVAAPGTGFWVRSTTAGTLTFSL